MEVNKLFKNVNNLNKYIAVTQDISNKYENAKIQFNMSSVLSLKKIRSLEIEYFNKSEDNGAACMILEKMLNTPPSKTWNILGKELVNLLQYWLDAIRKHLISHSIHWWTFLKLLLRFIQEIRTKDPTIPNQLVELTAECLLDLATNDRPDPSQRRDILACLNMFCAESGREIRFAMRNKFGNYFIKLSSYMCTCGHVPCQYSALETLVRWLLPRHEPAVRLAAADKWLPVPLCRDIARDVFLKRPWMDFFQDARAFLNAHNKAGDLITSVVIRKLIIGPIVVISDKEKREAWLDVNAAQKCISVLLESKILEAISVTIKSSCEALVISCDDVETAQLSRESPDVIISLRALHTPRMTSSLKIADDNEDKRDVTIVISSRCELRNVDKALRSVFDHKYQLLLDLNNELPLSPENTKNIIGSEEDTKLSHPTEIRRRKHSGYIVGSRNPAAWKSPSTASTSSLLHLHEKLAALPRYRFEKEQISVCVKPELSSVTELSETDDKHSLNTTLKLKRYGVCYKSLNTNVGDNRKSQSDTEGVKRRSKTRNLSPVVNENAASCLLVATIGSDESVINETLERLAKNKDYSTDNIVDLLVQEALYSKQIEEKDKIHDSGINTGENKKTPELERIVEEIENTPCEDIPITTKDKIPCTVISRSTSDESNTDAVNETPDYVSVRRKTFKRKVKQREIEKTNDDANEITFDVNAVEEFFSQHFTENRAGEIVISPTLAKKINETSSETSDFENQYLTVNDDDLNKNVENIETENDIDIIKCLNSIVDSVCNDFDKCTEYLNQENDDIVRNERCEDTPLNEATTADIKSNTLNKPRKSIKLKYKVVLKKAKPKQKVTSKKTKKNKLDNSKSKMSTIMEDNEIITIVNTNNEEVREIETERKAATPENKKAVVRSMRRKRKLYSPKDVENKIDAENHIPDSENVDIAHSEIKSITKINTPKAAATCYKEIEKERRRCVRQPRKRKSNARIPSPPSPRSHRINTLFDKLKNSFESSEKITLADNIRGNDVYNFTSDSEDEDFKKKKVIQKRNSTTTIGSFESAMSTRQGRGNRVNYSENISSNDDNTKKRGPVRRKKVSKRRNSKNKTNVGVEIDLEDERMRQAIQKELNTSLIMEKRKQSADKEPELVLDTAPVMEFIAENDAKGKKNDTVRQKKKAYNKNKKSELIHKTQKKHVTEASLSKTLNTEDDGTLSPLPGLVVETVPSRQDDENGSVSTNMLQKYKKIYQDGPDAYINESNTTQNLLSDVDKNNISINKNVTDELDLTVNANLVYNPTINLTADENFDNTQIINLTVNDDMETDLTNLNVKSDRTYKPKKKPFPKVKDIKRNVQSIEPIKIAENINAKRSVSIATIGITGHGDFEESPPNINLIQETFKPRNLSIDDYDQSIKDYYVKLTNEINQCDDITSIVKTTKRDSKMNSDGVEISPVVSIQRLSFDDISKWLPSRRTSDSDQNSTIEHNSVKMISQQSSKSGIARAKNKYMESNECSEKTKIMNLNRDDVTKRPITRSRSYINDTDKNACVEIAEIESVKTRSKQKIKDTKSLVNRKSMISPIQLFDDFQPKDDKKSVISDDDCVKNIRKIFSKEKDTKCSESTRQYNFKKGEVEMKDHEMNERSFSLVSVDSSSTNEYGSTKRSVKRHSSPVIVEVKKKKSKVNYNVENIAIGSDPSASSVNDWFRRNVPTSSRAERIDASFNDSIQNIMEKLDTSLVEIHQNTSKQFVHMFVDVQKHLSELKAERRSMYKQVAKDTLTEIVKIIDNKFADLDRRSQEMDSDFMSQLKVRATELIREDCKRKHAMVLLLKEDVQSVVDHINKSRRLESP